MRKSLATLISALCFASCAPSTPLARIEKSPEKFAALSTKDQELVRQGQIARGMTTDAVELAWGKPAQRFEGLKHSKPTERWDYVATTPVYFTGFMGGYGYSGYGPYGRGGYGGVGFGLGPEVAYVPYRSASVWFVDHQVDSWERAR